MDPAANSVRDVAQKVEDKVDTEIAAHSAGHERPLRSYALFLATYGSAVATGCPFCLGQWVGTAFVGGFIVAPRATRAVASVFAVVTASDTLQFAYAALERSEQQG